jgi:CRISPR-associated protein Csn2
MKLFYNVCDLEIEIKEGCMTGIVFDNPAMFRTFVENLWNQTNGMEGEISLTKGDKPVKLQKEGCVIFNPYAIDLNDKKILSHIYNEMKELVEHDFYVRKSEINASIVSLLDDLEPHFPYPLVYSLELDFTQLLKVYGVKIELQCEELVERLVNYVRLVHQVLGTELFIFIHLEDYFNRDELKKLEEMILYEQISILLIENRVDMEEKENQKWWIVDKDSCIIEI